MDATAPAVPISGPGFLTRILLWISGVDEETLHECPAHDWNAAQAIALLLIFVWLYQGGLIAIVAHRLLAPDGNVHLGLVLMSLFIATLMLLIDSYVFVRAGFHADGIRELARAGLDLSGGFGAKLKAGIFLSVRILLSLGFAQLTAIFIALILYRADIAADLDHRYQQENAPLITAAQQRVDAEIQQAGNEVTAAQERVDALQKQITVTLGYLRSPAVWRNHARAQQAQAALPDLQQNLQAATSELNARHDDLAKRVNGRDDAIQKEVASSPARIDPDRGMLAQLTALRRIAADPETALVIVLIDLTSFGLELAAVLAKVTTFIPTTYAALLARNAYMRVTAIVDEIDAMTNHRTERGTPSASGASDRKSPYEHPRFAANSHQEASPPVKRKRGRPRKNGLNGGSPAPAGDDDRHPE